MTQEFDIAAGSYDGDFTHSHTGMLQRELVWKYLDQRLTSDKKLHVLELNCGTGEDALHLAQSGHVVTATDISTEMLAQAKSKIQKQGLSCKVHLKQADINTLEDWNDSEKYDLVFSNFGGLNCITAEELLSFKTKISNYLRPNGSIILVLMSELCLWESFYFILKFRFDQVFRRKKPYVMADVKGVKVKTWYYSPKKLRRLFAPEFRSVKLKPIGFFGPPSYLEPLMKRNFWFFKTLCFLERQLGRFAWQGPLADHYYIELEGVGK